MAEMAPQNHRITQSPAARLQARVIPMMCVTLQKRNSTVSRTQRAALAWWHSEHDNNRDFYWLEFPCKTVGRLTDIPGRAGWARSNSWRGWRGSSTEPSTQSQQDQPHRDQSHVPHQRRRTRQRGLKHTHTVRVRERDTHTHTHTHTHRAFIKRKQRNAHPELLSAHSEW